MTSRHLCLLLCLLAVPALAEPPSPPEEAAVLDDAALVAIAHNTRWPTDIYAGKGVGAPIYSGLVPPEAAVLLVHQEMARRGYPSTGRVPADWSNAALGISLVYGAGRVPEGAERGVLVLPEASWGGPVRLGREEADALALRVQGLRLVRASLDEALRNAGVPVATR